MANRLQDGFVVDPNSFDGQNSSSNFFVPYEDLTILVELTSQKKGRTLLTTTQTGSVSENNKGFKINFIQGESFGSKRFLTTKFTELTTNFDRENSTENLGLTSIDIDFNSSFAPMITIQFVDVRGSAIFQNEDKTANNENDYSIFFQLPYPLYKLKIKGYYGQPVEYCLHMTKFTSRFNSQTGNFEITASFVGYTYAMLSDMLVGYLKAISYTDLGKKKYDELKSEDPNLITLDELYDKISKINENVGRILSNSEDYSQLKLAETKIGLLKDIRGTIQNFSESVDINKKSSTYDFAIVDPKNKEYDKYAKTYRESVGGFIDSYNENNDIPLDKNEFLNIKKYDKLTLKILSDPTNDYAEAKKLLNSSTNPEETRKKLLSFINNNNYGLQDFEFNAVDNTNLYKKLDDALTKINSDIDFTKKRLAEGLNVEVKSNLDFDPSIRNIIKIFTAAAEVFMYCIHEVSKEAIKDSNVDRINELKKVFANPSLSSDLPNNSVANNGNDNLIPKYYPWPDYRRERDKILEEAYLGELGVLENPNNVDELVFINDLLKAFIEQANKQNDIDRLAESLKLNWVPSNPLDTRVFGNTVTPYKRINPKTQEELLVMVLLRAATFLGITNNEATLTSDEIIAMANFEAQAVMNDAPNKGNVVQSLSQLKSESDILKKTKGVINGKDSFIFVEENGAYRYRYILPENIDKYFPINDSFYDAQWPNNLTQLKEKEISGSLFLGNHYFYKNPTNPTNSIDDGAIYVRIVDKEEYLNNAANYSLPTGLNKDSIIKLQELKAIEDNVDSVGFNCFGGLYGIQEFSRLDWGDENLAGLPLSTLFYSNAYINGKTGVNANGLGYFRSVSNQQNQSQPTSSQFDVKPSKYKVSSRIENILDMFSKPSKMLHMDYGKTIELTAKQVKDGVSNISYPYIHFNVSDEKLIDRPFNTLSITELNDVSVPVSLFGSRLYYGQTSEKAKAFLFLHTLPWNGLITKTDEYFTSTRNSTIFTYAESTITEIIQNIFTFNWTNTLNKKDSEILNLFKYRAGFVYAPKLWVAFVGGLLWRKDSQSDPITFFNGTSLIPTFGNKSPQSHPDVYPKQDEYLTYSEFTLFGNQVEDSRQAFPGVPMAFINRDTFVDYKKIDEVLLKLPNQAKEEFKNFFLDFVNSNDWSAIKSELELTTQGTWSQTYQAATTLNGGVLTQTGDEFFVNTASMKQLYGPNFDNYIIFNPYLQTEYKDNYFLEIKDDAVVTKILTSVLQKEVIISNMSYRIWDKQDLSVNQNNVSNIVISKENAELYVQTFLKNFEGMTPITEEQQKKEIKNSIFGTSDDNLIKFMLYRTCKNMYDKWVSESEDGDSVFFQCGGRNDTDLALAKKRSNSDSAKPRLIDSFRFISRSFEDIGDRFAVNPFPIHDVMRTQPNTSLYDIVTSILSSNNFDFIALPSFINYRDLEKVKSVFTPYPTYTDSDVSGPSFVCMYVGQSSKHLDFNKSNYPNDGFDVRVGDSKFIDVPPDFTSPMNDYEDPTVFFRVRFGQQNQNIFKDVTLDQSEFGETAESLQIMDDISKKGAETYRTLAGQNIYNVYSTRSYKVEVEMMGNAMIQPMMYFQLDNIPMFHGAYVITRVKHSIKPNHMSTSFTGSRIRKPATPIFEAGDLYMSLIDTIDAANINPSEASRPLGSKPYPPIIITLYERGGSNGNAGSLGLVPIQAPNGISNTISGNKDKNQLIPEAVDSLNQMLTDWVSWMKSNGFVGNNGAYAYINSGFRTYEDQKAVYDEAINKETVAPIGTSNHGWGIAVDFQFFTKNGNLIKNYKNGEPNVEEGYNFNINESIVWLLENGYTYGWIIPEKLRDNTGLEEFWHFEYHGKSAACILKKRATIKTKVINTDKPYKDFVKNPKDKNGNEVVYTTCEFKSVDKNLDGIEVTYKLENKNISVVPPSSADIQFYTQILTGIGAQSTPENLKFLYAWRQAEGAKAAWNPFNTTQSDSSATAFSCRKGKSFVKNYASKDIGLKATVDTLTNGNYPEIVNGLKNNVGAYKLSLSKNLFTWGTGAGVNNVLAGSSVNPPPISQSSVQVKSCG